MWEPFRRRVVRAARQRAAGGRPAGRSAERALNGAAGGSRTPAPASRRFTRPRAGQAPVRRALPFVVPAKMSVRSSPIVIFRRLASTAAEYARSTMFCFTVTGRTG